MWRKLKIPYLMTLLLGLSLSSRVLGQTHSYMNQMRSSDVKYFFFQQSVDGEIGIQKMTVQTAEDGTTLAEPKQQIKGWKGVGIDSTMGMEILRFIQFQVGHTFVNLNGQDDGLATLSGSRVHGGVRAVFTAPVANLEMGAGVLGSRLDYRLQLNNTSLYGSGSYAAFGLSYFFSTRVSLFGEGRMIREHLVRSGGSPISSAIDTEINTLGIGFRIWL
jgi:hypothetical protein